MRTPAGKECRHYFQDFHRGRNIRQCRLIHDNPDSQPWKAVDCGRCQVPDILNANASPDLRLKLGVRSTLLGMRRVLELRAWCRDKEISVAAAYTGCVSEEVDRRLDVFRAALAASGDDDETKPEDPGGTN